MSMLRQNITRASFSPSVAQLLKFLAFSWRPVGRPVD